MQNLYLFQKSVCPLCNQGQDGNMAREDFEKIKNQEDWKALWEVIQEHEVNVQVGKHTYSDWILREMEERREKNG